MTADPTPHCQVIWHGMLQTHRSHASDLMAQWGTENRALQGLAQALGALQKNGQSLDVPNVQRAVALLRVPQQIKALRLAGAVREQAIEALRNSARTHDLQTGAANARSGFATPVLTALEPNAWLLAQHRFITKEDKDSAKALMRHYLIAEDNIGLNASDIWHGVRKTALLEAQRYAASGELPSDVTSGRYTQAQFFERLSSLDAYVRYLKGDVQAFSGIANQRFYPQLRLHQLKADANNGGVLLRAQLQSLVHEPFAANRQEIAVGALQHMQKRIKADWFATSTEQPRPSYTEFAQFLDSPAGHKVWGTAVHLPSDTDRKILLYQARVLDFIRQIEQRVNLEKTTAGEVSEQAIGQVKQKVDGQIQLIRERGVNLTGARIPFPHLPSTSLLNAPDNTLSNRALKLLTDLSDKLGNALERTP